MAARSLQPPSQQKPARVAALSENPLGPIVVEERRSETAASEELRERLIWELLKGMGRDPGLDPNYFPKSEILELITSPEAQSCLSPILVTQICSILHLKLPTVEIVDSPSPVEELHERFWLCDRCRKHTHSNYIYQNSLCPCKVCFICIDQYRYTRCPKCMLHYSDAQLAEVRDISRYWKGQFQEQ